MLNCGVVKVFTDEKFQFGIIYPITLELDLKENGQALYLDVPFRILLP